MSLYDQKIPHVCPICGEELKIPEEAALKVQNGEAAWVNCPSCNYKVTISREAAHDMEELIRQENERTPIDFSLIGGKDDAPDLDIKQVCPSCGEALQVTPDAAFLIRSGKAVVVRCPGCNFRVRLTQQGAEAAEEGEEQQAASQSYDRPAAKRKGRVCPICGGPLSLTEQEIQTIQKGQPVVVTCPSCNFQMKASLARVEEMDQMMRREDESAPLDSTLVGGKEEAPGQDAMEEYKQ